MNPFFPEIRHNFGFGCMRLPMKGENVDADEFARMVDAFLAAGFNYFDTAHGYLGGKSETAIKAGLTSRYPRESFILTNKLSGSFFSCEADIRPLFESQLRACGVEYFDFYLMHAQGRQNFEKYKNCRAYETAFALRDEGKVRHVGISFHDRADVLERILTEYPGIEVVQIQFNYLDYEDPSIESRKCYEVCRKHGKPVIVMEPVKGGRLIDLPREGQEALDALGGGSNASYAIRFAAGFEGVAMVLSGMGSMAMMNDNVGFMKDFRTLGKRETDALAKVCGAIRKENFVSCTACRYCTERCPQNIPIPALFSCLNERKKHPDGGGGFYYRISTAEKGKASDCIGCGQCEESCPQHLPVRELLGEVRKEFEET